MLSIKNLVKTYAGQAIINDLNVETCRGEAISIRGASGSGKSTLLSLIAGFDTPDSGTLFINRVTLPFNTAAEGDAFRRNQLGVVFQSYNLLDCLNVWDNIAFTARLKGNNDSDFQHSLMSLLKISELANKTPSTLSGGEQQRVAIARALVHKPSLVLADEPTGNLDEETSDAVAEALYSTCKQLNTTLIVVTHSQDVAERADRALWLRHGQLKSA